MSAILIRVVIVMLFGFVFATVTNPWRRHKIGNTIYPCLLPYCWNHQCWIWSGKSSLFAWMHGWSVRCQWSVLIAITTWSVNWVGSIHWRPIKCKPGFRWRVEISLDSHTLTCNQASELSEMIEVLDLTGRMLLMNFPIQDSHSHPERCKNLDFQVVLKVSPLLGSYAYERSG